MPTLQGKFRTAGLMLLGATLAIAPAFSQQDAPPPPSGQGDMQHGHGGHGMSPEQRLAKMTTALNLTEEQQTAVKQVWADQRAKMMAQRDQMKSMSQDDRHAAMMAAHKDEESKIQAILTSDQKTKYEAMQAEMREHRQHNGDNATPPPPPQQ